MGQTSDCARSPKIHDSESNRGDDDDDQNDSMLVCMREYFKVDHNRICASIFNAAQQRNHCQRWPTGVSEHNALRFARNFVVYLRNCERNAIDILKRNGLEWPEFLTDRNRFENTLDSASLRESFCLAFRPLSFMLSSCKHLTRRTVHLISLPWAIPSQGD